MDTLSLPVTVTFKMEESKLYFGGVPPGNNIKNSALKISATFYGFR
jgi:hypothetical protein